MGEQLHALAMERSVLEEKRRAAVREAEAARIRGVLGTEAVAVPVGDMPSSVEVEVEGILDNPDLTAGQKAQRIRRAREKKAT